MKTKFQRITKRLTNKRKKPVKPVMKKGTWVRVIDTPHHGSIVTLRTREAPVGLVSYLIEDSWFGAISLAGNYSTSIDCVEAIKDKKLKFLCEMNREPFIDE